MIDNIKEIGREIPPEGSGPLYILGEAPGQNEDRAGKAFVGSAGNLLFRTLQKFGISRSQTRVANVFWCRPPLNNIEKAKRMPEFLEYREKTLQDIREHRPKAILCLGKTALEALFGDAYKISEIRGYWLFFEGIPCLVTWHPASVLRDFSQMLSFSADIRKICRYIQGLETLPSLEEFSFHENSQEEFLKLCDVALQNHLPYALDIEVHQGETWTMDLVGIAVNVKPFDTSRTYATANCFPSPPVIEKLRELSQKVPQNAIFHNAAFDLTWLYGEHKIEWLSAPHDTMLMHHILLPDQKKSLEFCASFWLTVPAWKFLSQVSPTFYNAMDCLTTLLLFERLQDELRSRGYWEVYDLQKRQELLPAVFMGYLGLKLDLEEQERLRQEVEQKMSQIREEMSSLFPETSSINLNSHQQLKILLYQEWKLPPVLEKGKITTSEKAIQKLLQKLKDKDPQKLRWLQLYLEWKELSSILSKELQIQPHPWTGLVHTSYSVAGTETARWSSSAPVFCKSGSKTIGGTNLQNRSKPYRSQFKPRFEGWIFVGADYSGAEARIVAYRCNDEQSKKAFQEGRDIHKLTASLMFGIPEHEVTPELRKIGKTIRHASNYDMGWRKLSEIMMISASQAKDLLERYHSAFPKIRSVFHRRTAEIVQKTRKLEDAWGLPRFFTGRLNDPDTLREAYAFYPQSTCTHTLNKALLKLWEWSKDKTWVALNLQIHDELVLTCEANPEAVKEVLHKIKECMEIEIPIFDLDTEQIVPLILPVEFKIGPSWGQMHEFKSLSEALSFADDVKPFDIPSK